MITEQITTIAVAEVVKYAVPAASVAAAWIGRTMYNRSKARQAKRNQQKGKTVIPIVLLCAALLIQSGCAMWDAMVIGVGDSIQTGQTNAVSAIK